MTSSTPYHVSHATDVAAQFSGLADVATRRGRLREFVHCAKWIMSELELTPLEFGEARYSDSDHRMLFRFAQIGPIIVEYAVVEQEKCVFLRRFRLRYPGE